MATTSTVTLNMSGTTFMGTRSVYATYALMIANHKSGSNVLVLDASGDSTVEAGSATYLFTPPSAGGSITAANFTKTSESESITDMATVTAAINLINAKLGTGFTAEDTVKSVVDAINAKIGEGFTAEDTVAAAIAAINALVGVGFSEEDTIAEAISAIGNKADGIITDRKFIIVSTATNLAVGKKYVTKVASVCTLPNTNLADGDVIEIGTVTGVTTSTVVLADGATDTIEGAADPITLSTANQKITLVYDLAATNWIRLNA